MLVTINFSFSHNYFKSVIFQGRYCVVVNIYPFPKLQILEFSKLEEFADDNFQNVENCGEVSDWVENSVGKGEIAQ